MKYKLPFTKWWDEEGKHLPQNNLELAEAAWEAAESLMGNHGLVELSIRCKLEGMIAENSVRLALGQALAYNDESFFYLGKDAWEQAWVGETTQLRDWRELAERMAGTLEKALEDGADSYWHKSAKQNIEDMKSMKK